MQARRDLETPEEKVSIPDEEITATPMSTEKEILERLKLLNIAKDLKKNLLELQNRWNAEITLPQFYTLKVKGEKLNCKQIKELVMVLNENPQVDTLDISGCQLEDDGIVGYLIEAIYLKNLNVSNCNIGNVGAYQLANHPIGNITSLNLQHNHIDADGIKFFTQPESWLQKKLTHFEYEDQEINHQIVRFSHSLKKKIRHQLSANYEKQALDTAGELKQLEQAISFLKSRQPLSNIDEEVLQDFIDFYQLAERDLKLLPQKQLVKTSYPITIPAITYLARQLPATPNEDRAQLANDVKSKMDQQLEQHPVISPMSPGQRSVIGALIGGIVGFSVGVIAFGLATAWSGSWGAFPGAFVGATIGALSGFTFGTKIGILSGLTMGLFLGNSTYAYHGGFFNRFGTVPPERVRHIDQNMREQSDELLNKLTDRFSPSTL